LSLQFSPEKALYYKSFTLPKSLLPLPEQQDQDEFEFLEEY
jgi:hypothetical protein